MSSNSKGKLCDLMIGDNQWLGTNGHYNGGTSLWRLS
jgi:hypothetical protein